MEKTKEENLLQFESKVKVIDYMFKYYNYIFSYSQMINVVEEMTEEELNYDNKIYTLYLDKLK